MKPSHPLLNSAANLGSLVHSGKGRSSSYLSPSRFQYLSNGWLTMGGRREKIRGRLKTLYHFGRTWTMTGLSLQENIFGRKQF